MTVMSKTIINARQIKAARALLDLSQEQLAAASGISVATIRRIESSHISPRGNTMNSIETALSEAGVEFYGTSGVRLRDEQIITLEGEDCYEQFLESLYPSMKENGGEILFMHADLTRASQREISTLLLMKKKGIRFRRLAEEGDTYISFPLKETRWIPSKYFKPNLQVIYNDYVAVCIYPDSKMRKISKVVVVRNKHLAEAMRNDFNFLWDNCRKPTSTTAKEIYA